MAKDDTGTAPFRRDSGDLTADRRADYAEMLFGSGENTAAAEVMLGALDLAPEWSLGWFRLGEMHEAAGDMAEAVLAWRMARALDPADRAGAALKLQLARQAPMGAAPPSAFVEALFDQYADTFEQALVDTLSYRVPEILMTAIGALGIPRFRRAVDLGCGTGLMGERLRAIVDDLDGHDISAAMLKQAREKRIYDRLVQSDLQTLVLPPGGADLIVCADVFMYVGRLERVFAMVAAALSDGGIFGFSVETSSAGPDLLLQPSRRYAHSQAYVRAVLAANGFGVLSLDEHVIRHDRGQPVNGLVVVAGRL